VTVVDTSTGLYVCNAAVSGTDGPVTIAAPAVPEAGTTPSESDAGCSYSLFPTQPGTFVLSVNAYGLHENSPPPQVTLGSGDFGACGYDGNPHEVTVSVGP
jgi:hypothetical protein